MGNVQRRIWQSVRSWRKAPRHVRCGDALVDRLRKPLDRLGHDLGERRRLEPDVLCAQLEYWYHPSAMALLRMLPCQRIECCNRHGPMHVRTCHVLTLGHLERLAEHEVQYTPTVCIRVHERPKDGFLPGACNGFNLYDIAMVKACMEDRTLLRSRNKDVRDDGSARWWCQGRQNRRLRQLWVQQAATRPLVNDAVGSLGH
mmetsp:Transcript_103290/g.296635  ORF Transcript_103290/g.296635 Transcript_103290/m.296635 type:complete len:201 (+) Transcript_103290:394-996(+)